MKAFISIDLEGLPFIVIPGHLGLKGSLFDEARRITTKVALIVADELNKNGFDEVLLADSHGAMVNVLVDELPEYVEIIRGNPRPASMVAGVEECDVALFLGYHAKFGTEKSTFDHTYSGASIHNLVINGTSASEYLLNSLAAGEYDVPVILVAGDEKLLETDVKQHTPWAERVTLKRSLSRLAARSPSMKKIEELLRIAVKKATKNFNDKKVKPLKAGKNVKIDLTFRTSFLADIEELLPIVTRKNGLEIEYEAKDIIEAYKIFQLLCWAASGANSFMQYVS